MAVKFKEQEWADATAEASGWEPSVVIDTEEYAGIDFALYERRRRGA